MFEHFDIDLKNASFEWDEEKDRINFMKHGIHFRTAAKVFLDDGTEHIAVTNVGVRPTVSNENRVSVESHLLDFQGNLYGRHARVEFCHFQRPERHFESMDELAEQIRLDTETTRAWFSMQ